MKAKITKKEALEYTARLWNWLSRNPEKEKDDWPEWEKYKRFGKPKNYSACFLCLWNIQEESRLKNKYNLDWAACDDYKGRNPCLLTLFDVVGVEGCQEPGSPYILWCTGKDGKDNETQYATKIANAARDEIKKLEELEGKQ